MTSFSVDTTGSYLRPQRLLEAREKYRNKQITHSELQLIEDEEIKTLVQKQVEAGLPVVCDGEFRRSSYIYDFWAPFGDTTSNDHIFGIYPNVAALQQVFESEKPPKFSAENPFSVYAKGKISYNPNHPEFRAFEYLKSITPSGIIPKVIVAAPNFLLVFRDWKTDKWPSYYPTLNDYLSDIAEAFKKTLLRFYELGARLIHIDDPTWFIWAHLLGGTPEEQRQIQQELIDYAIRTIKPAFDALPKDCKVGIHICRGNGQARWVVPFGYKEVLRGYAALNADYLLLEWDDERSGSFEVLSEYISQCPKTKFFLGVISTKNDVIDKYEDIEAKIKEASKYAPLERLGLCPQCGFHTSISTPNPASEATQWGKVKLLGEFQKRLWGGK